MLFRSHVFHASLRSLRRQACCTERRNCSGCPTRRCLARQKATCTASASCSTPFTAAKDRSGSLRTRRERSSNGWPTTPLLSRPSGECLSIRLFFRLLGVKTETSPVNCYPRCSNALVLMRGGAFKADSVELFTRVHQLVKSASTPEFITATRRCFSKRAQLTLEIRHVSLQALMGQCDGGTGETIRAIRAVTVKVIARQVGASSAAHSPKTKRRRHLCRSFL